MIKTGDIIKSLDFPGIDGFYLIGEVTSVDGDMINGKVIKVVFENEVVAKKNWFAKTFCTPLEGKMLNDKRFPGRITVIA